jgi:hypothetical protein
VEAAIQTQNTHNLVEKREKHEWPEKEKKLKKNTITQTRIRRRKKEKEALDWSRDCKDLEHKYFIYGSLEQGPGGTKTETRKGTRIACETCFTLFVFWCKIGKEAFIFRQSGPTSLQGRFFYDWVPLREGSLGLFPNFRRTHEYRNRQID